MYKDTDIDLKGKTQTCAHNMFGGWGGGSCLLLKRPVHGPPCVLSVVSFSCPEKITFTIHWYLKYYPCHNEFHNIEVNTLQNDTDVGGLCACRDVIVI